MIAKIYLSLILTFTLHVSYGLDKFVEKSSVYYIAVAKKYNICPPSLEYGYPINYKHDSLPITAIIYLRHDLDELIRLDEITYVAEPTRDNAENIYHFCGERGIYPKYYIIPDSNLTYYEVQQFMEELTPRYGRAEVLLVGREFRYGQVLSVDLDVDFNIIQGTRCFFGMGWSYIMLNSENEILYRTSPLLLDSIYHKIFEYYTDNLNGNDNNPDVPLYSLLTIPRLERKISELNERMKNIKESGDPYIKQLLKKIKLLESTKSGSIMEISKRAAIVLKANHRNRPLWQYYNLINEINKGLLIARNEYGLYLFETAYIDLISSKNLTELDVLNFTMPDLIQYQFGEYEIIPPRPPIIENVEIIDEK